MNRTADKPHLEAEAAHTMALPKRPGSRAMCLRVVVLRPRQPLRSSDHFPDTMAGMRVLQAPQLKIDRQRRLGSCSAVRSHLPQLRACANGVSPPTVLNSKVRWRSIFVGRYRPNRCAGSVPAVGYPAVLNPNRPERYTSECHYAVVRTT